MLQKDPRVERTEQRVRAAAVAELAAVGWGALTIEGVAARAGVARTTIYRHWRDKRALLADALEAHSTQPPAGDERGRARVVSLLAHLIEVLAASALIPALVDAAERDDDMRRALHAFSARRRQSLVDALAEVGVADPEHLAAALAGAVVYRRFLTDEPLAPGDAGALVEAVLGPEPTSPLAQRALPLTP